MSLSDTLSVWMDTSMREPTFLILVALADAERHGYGIIREVEKLSEVA